MSSALVFRILQIATIRFRIIQITTIRFRSTNLVVFGVPSLRQELARQSARLQNFCQIFAKNIATIQSQNLIELVDGVTARKRPREAL